MITTMKRNYLFVAVILVVVALVVRLNYLPPTPPKIEPQPTGVSQAAIEEFKREAREDAKFLRRGKKVSYRVSTSGITAANGIYSRAGTCNRTDYYAKSGYVIYWDGSSKWILSTAVGGPSLYEGFDGDIDAVPVGLWAITAGPFPSPSVSIVRSGKMLSTVKHH